MSGSRTSGPGRLSGPDPVDPRGRLMSGPGRLAEADDAQDAATRTGQNTLIPPGSLAELAAEYGLKPSAARPPLLEYIKRIWRRRFFVTGFATAQNVAMYTEARLGQVWQILTPLLNVAVYYLIFGLILDTSRGVPHFLQFLIIGVFIFNFTQRSFIISARVMWDSLPLIRALYFPRACLPLGYVLIELQQLAISMIVVFAAVLVIGQPITWSWLLIVPILVMQTLFNVGAAFILARFGAGFDDVSQLLPFLVRTWFYVSGVMFSIQTFHNLYLHPTIARILQYNPAAIYITLVRYSLMQSVRLTTPGSKPYNQALCTLYYHPPPAPPHATAAQLAKYHEFLAANMYNSAHCHALVSQTGLWVLGAFWAVVILGAGFVFFWRAEVQYGRG